LSRTMEPSVAGVVAMADAPWKRGSG
jgi:hypothetical protein